MGKDINLDGTEISIVKALGFTGEISGKVLMDRVSELDVAELIDALNGLVSFGYVVSDKSAFYNSKELEAANFQVNSGYARDLKAVLDPSLRDQPKSRRIRRE